jgi:FkbM family methyltransferase
MIPEIDALATKAAAMLASVPAAIIGGTQPAALYGMGFLGRWALPDLAARGVRFDRCYDGNPAMAGKAVDGVPVHAVDTIETDRPAFVFISARHAVLPISARLDELGVTHISCDAFYVARDFAAFHAIHDTLLDDERSRLVLRAVLATMLTGDRAYVISVYEKDQYFALPQFSGIEKETYVDAGAYVGDSLERFVWTHYGIFNRAIAFEPGPRQFSALKVRTERLRSEWALDEGQIELVPAALGEAAAIAHAESQSGQMTSLALEKSGDQEIRIETLDDFLAGQPITFLKADVEGMEMPLLKGAADTIRAFRPKLAICVYHYPSDIPVISHYLKSLVPEYRFALRHHSPQFMETVLYAWVET